MHWQVYPTLNIYIFADKQSLFDCCFSISPVSKNNEMDGFFFFVVLARCWRVRWQINLRKACHLQKHGRGFPVSLSRRVQCVRSGTDSRRLVVLRRFVSKTRQFASTDCHAEVPKVFTFCTVWTVFFGKCFFFLFNSLTQANLRKFWFWNVLKRRVKNLLFLSVLTTLVLLIWQLGPLGRF